MLQNNYNFLDDKFCSEENLIFAKMQIKHFRFHPSDQRTSLTQIKSILQKLDGGVGSHVHAHLPLLSVLKQNAFIISTISENIKWVQRKQFGLLLRGLGRKGRSKKVHPIRLAPRQWKERLDRTGRVMEGKTREHLMYYRGPGFLAVV